MRERARETVRKSENESGRERECERERERGRERERVHLLIRVDIQRWLVERLVRNLLIPVIVDMGSIRELQRQVSHGVLQFLTFSGRI